jgi:hypothetical protein
MNRADKIAARRAGVKNRFDPPQGMPHPGRPDASLLRHRQLPRVLGLLGRAGPPEKHRSRDLHERTTIDPVRMDAWLRNGDTWLE